MFMQIRSVGRSICISRRSFRLDLDLKQSYCRDLRDCQTYFPCAVFSSGFSYLFVIKRCPTGQIFDEKKQKCVKNTSEEPGCAKQVSKEKPRTSRFRLVKRKNDTQRQQQLKLPVRPSAVKRKNFEQERTEPDEQLETTLATSQADEPGQDHWQRVCYVTNWSRYRAGEAKFEIEYIDPFMCSHIVYAYATVDDNKPEIIPVQKEDIGNERRRRRLFSFAFPSRTLSRVGAVEESQSSSEDFHSIGREKCFVHPVSEKAQADRSTRSQSHLVCRSID